MKHLIIASLVIGLTSTTFGRDPILVPRFSAPVGYNQPAPTPVPEAGIVPPPSSHIMPGAPVAPGTIVGNAYECVGIPLYRNVRVIQRRNIHPCAVRKVVSVPDPCNPCCCVYIEICVPPCACECVTVNRRGDKVRFDYGRYAVDVTSRRGRLLVDYDD